MILLSDTNLFWTILYRIALTGKPGHNAVVVRWRTAGWEP